MIQQPTRGRASYAGDEQILVIIIDRGLNSPCATPPQNPPTDRSYDSLDDDDIFDCEYVLKSEATYANEDVQIRF
ncbi:hypothetical protein DJ75_14015 [Halorubrum sp. Eb13]|nr:hypothetical protein DJ75_14015 [Halorubrum sp. Eb13]